MKLDELDGEKLERQNLPSACEADKANIVMYSKPGRQSFEQLVFPAEGCLDFYTGHDDPTPPREHDRKQRTQICIKLPT